MEFKQLEAFVAVVDYGSFSEAARKLYLTQPTISAHVRSLEEELHTKLIIRTTKKTTITTKGYQLYDSAVRMLEIRNNLLENFTGVQKHMIDLAGIHDSVLPICCRKSWLPTEKRTRILIFTLSRQIVQSPSTASLTALWTWRWLDRIPAMRAVSFFLSVRMNLSLQPR